MKYLAIVLLLVSLPPPPHDAGGPRYVQVGRDCYVYANGSARVARNTTCPETRQ